MAFNFTLTVLSLSQSHIIIIITTVILALGLVCLT